MYTKIWRPGEESELDALFDDLREQQYQNKKDPLHSNYTKKAFANCEALSITFNSDDTPLVLSSIFRRNIWPPNTFRICNRFWKVKNERLVLVDKDTGLHIVSKSIYDQTMYAQNTLNADLIFLSRQFPKWQKFVIRQIQKHTGLEFKCDNYKYLTCENRGDPSCWQTIIYIGNGELLNQWSKK